ncbi:MAG: hypothetical protein Q9170_002183, partial [Blastenia crenularia]
MAHKRKSQSSFATTPTKRLRHDDFNAEGTAFSSSQTQVDPTYGQRGAFPGLDAEEDALFYGPASDGLEYLRMVRSEAKTVPNLLTTISSSSPKKREDLYTPYPQAFYSDGAYVSIPAPTALQPNQPLDPQEAYHSSLLTRYHALRAHLHASSPPSPPSTLTPLLTAPQSRWRTTLLYKPPTPTLLAHLPQEAVINGIAALERFLDWRFLKKGKYVGAWAWGLLARCREVGMMGSEEVGVLRGLGKKAGALVREMEAGLGGGKADAASLGGETEDGEEMGQDEGQSENEAEDPLDVDDIPFANKNEETPQPHPNTSSPPPIPPPPSTTTDISAAKSRLLKTLRNSSSPISPQQSPQPETPPLNSTLPLPAILSSDANTILQIVTLDTILTIIGSEYGQRDLLARRA